MQSRSLPFLLISVCARTHATSHPHLPPSIGLPFTYQEFLSTQVYLCLPQVQHIVSQKFVEVPYVTFSSVSPYFPRLQVIEKADIVWFHSATFEYKYPFQGLSPKTPQSSPAQQIDVCGINEIVLGTTEPWDSDEACLPGRGQ